MYINNRRGIRNHFICLFLFFTIHMFILTGCQQEESISEADSLEMQSQAIIADQSSVSREETESEPISTEEMRDELFSAEEKNEGSVSTKEIGDEAFSAEDKNDDQATEETGKSLVFGEALITCNMDYFEKLCVCVPYFDDVENLDEDFYGGLVNSSICGPFSNRTEIVDFQNSIFSNGHVYKISRADMEEYMLLLFGKELPTYEPPLQDMLDNEVNFFYEDGFYYIGPFDPLDIIYTYVGCQLKENGNLTAEFSMSEAVNGKSTVFELAPADNENGFIIVSKQIKVTE